MNTYKVLIIETGEIREMKAESKIQLALQLKLKGIGAKIMNDEEIKKEDTAMPKVHNKHKNTAPPDAIYIGRGSKWGNPFIIDKHGSRNEVIAKYKEYILGKPELLAQLHEIKGKDLICYCAPQACHGDIFTWLITLRRKQCLKANLLSQVRELVN